MGLCGSPVTVTLSYYQASMRQTHLGIDIQQPSDFNSQLKQINHLCTSFILRRMGWLNCAVCDCVYDVGDIQSLLGSSNSTWLRNTCVQAHSAHSIQVLSQCACIPVQSNSTKGQSKAASRSVAANLGHHVIATTGKWNNN